MPRIPCTSYRCTKDAVYLTHNGDDRWVSCDDHVRLAESNAGKGFTTERLDQIPAKDVELLREDMIIMGMDEEYSQLREESSCLTDH